MLTELEELKPNLRVRIDEVFPAFSEEFTQYRRPWPNEILTKVGSLVTRIHLVLDDSLPVWPLNVAAYDISSPKINTITPFDPELGYIIDKRDTEWETRREKLESLWRELGYEDHNKPLYWNNEATVDHERAPLWLQVNEGGILTDEVKWLYRGSRHDGQFNPEVQPLINHLYLQVFFPHIGAEAKCSTSPNGLGLYFARFYPFDLGPLPYDPQHDLCKKHPFIGSAMNIHIPANFDKLIKIEARFIYRDDKGNLQEVKQ